MKRYIDPDKLLVTYQDPNLIQTLIYEFLKQTTADTSLLADIAADGISIANKTSALDIVHKIKGAASAIGALTIAAYCESVERALNDEIWIVADYNLGLLIEDIVTCLKLSQL